MIKLLDNKYFDVLDILLLVRVPRFLIIDKTWNFCCRIPEVYANFDEFIDRIVYIFLPEFQINIFSLFGTMSKVVNIYFKNLFFCNLSTLF